MDLHAVRPSRLSPAGENIVGYRHLTLGALPHISHQPPPACSKSPCRWRSQATAIQLGTSSNAKKIPVGPGYANRDVVLFQIAKPFISKMTRKQRHRMHKPAEKRGKGVPTTLRLFREKNIEAPARAKVAIRTIRNVDLLRAALSTRLPVGPTSGRIMQRI